MTKSQLKNINEGDTVWYWYKGLSIGSVEVQFIKFKPAESRNHYDLATIKTSESRLTPDKHGYLDVRISYLYSEDPGKSSTSGKKSGFLNKGVHGTRKFGK